MNEDDIKLVKRLILAALAELEVTVPLDAGPLYVRLEIPDNPFWWIDTLPPLSTPSAVENRPLPGCGLREEDDETS